MQTAQNTHENKVLFQKIPINQIRVNPNDPRKGVPAGAVESKMSSLQENGQETPIKVRPLSPEERASDPLHQYELIGGHLRLEAAQRLAWPTLDALVLDVSAEEAEWKAFMDNNWQEMNWLSRYLAVERRLQMRPDLQQQQIAAQWGVDEGKVSWALKVMNALNHGARAALLESFNQNPAREPISEDAMRTLTELWTDKPEDLETIEKSLGMALDRQMTEPQLAQLVRWVQSGKEPSAFPLPGQKAGHSSKPTPDPSDPYAHVWNNLPSNVRVIRNKTGYELRLKLAPSEAPTAVYSALAAIEHLKETALMPDSPPADPRFAQALPDLATEGRRLKALEQGLAAAKAADDRKNREDQKAYRARAAQAQRVAQKEAQKRDELENCKSVTKNHLETAFGPGPLSERLHQMALAGQNAETIKAVKTNLSVFGKSHEEQASFLKDLKLYLNKLSRLNPNKPKVKDTISGARLGQSAKAEPVANPSPVSPQPKPSNDHLGGQSQMTEEAHSPGLFDLVKGAVEKVAGNVTAGTLLDKGLNMLEKNAKQTTNYEMRKEMRRLFNDIL